MTPLSPPQIEVLHGLLVDAFKLEDLTQLVRFNLSYRLDTLAPEKKNLSTVVLELIDAVLERGELEALLRGVVRMRPDRPDLTAFVRGVAPEVFAKVDTQGLVGRVAEGLDKLASAAPDTGIWSLIGEFQATFRGVASQAKVLAAYKALHDGLHNLQLRMRSVEAAALAPPPDRGQAVLLAREVINLRNQARRATDLAAGLPTRGLEQLWIDDLVDVADEIGSKEPERIRRAVTVLGRVLQESYRIDGQMASAVAELPLEELITAMGEIVTRLGAGEVATAVTSARDALGAISPRLKGLVTEHNECQWLNKSLAGIESNPGIRPQDKVFGWPRVKTRLLALCQVFAAAAWSVELTSTIAAWEKAAETGNADDSEVAAVQVYAMVGNRFYEVDDDLLKLSDQLTEIGSPITNLLRRVR
jgi:Effector-associated domain 1